MQMWYLSNKCPVGVVALQMVRCHGWGQKWLSINIKHVYQWRRNGTGRQMCIVEAVESWHSSSHNPVSGRCPRMLSQCVQQMGVTTSLTNRRSTEWLPHWPAPPVLQSWMYGLFVMHHNTWVHHRWRWNSWELRAWGRYVLGQSQAHSC